jgi:hypothetical protein
MDFALLRFIQRTPRSIQKILPTGSCAVLCHELPKTINVRVRLPMEPARCDPDTCCAKVKSGFRSVDCRVFNRNQRFTKRSSPEGADTPQPWWSGTQPRGKGPKKVVARRGKSLLVSMPLISLVENEHRGVWLSRPILRLCRAPPGLKPWAQNH